LQKQYFQTAIFERTDNSTHRKQLKINSDRAFLGMFVGIDFIHYRWKKCPIGWQGQCENKDGELYNSSNYQSIPLEVACIFLTFKRKQWYQCAWLFSGAVWDLFWGQWGYLPSVLPFSKCYLPSMELCCTKHTQTSRWKWQHWAKVQEATRKDI